MVTWEGAPGMTAAEIAARKEHFRILVCIDGSDESYEGLRFANEIGQGDECEIILLFVRLIDQGLRSGGLQMRVARENMLEWGLELPGIQYLRRGLEMLIGEGQLADEWKEIYSHTDGVDGSRFRHLGAKVWLSFTTTSKRSHPPHLLIAISGQLRTGKSMLGIMEKRQTSRSGPRLRAALSSPTLLRVSAQDC